MGTPTGLRAGSVCQRGALVSPWGRWGSAKETARWAFTLIATRSKARPQRCTPFTRRVRGNRQVGASNDRRRAPFARRARPRHARAQRHRAHLPAAGAAWLRCRSSSPRPRVEFPTGACCARSAPTVSSSNPSTQGRSLRLREGPSATRRRSIPPQCPDALRSTSAEMGSGARSPVGPSPTSVVTGS